MQLDSVIMGEFFCMVVVRYATSYSEILLGVEDREIMEENSRVGGSQ
ncbi:hypothetical protein [Virgibacillus sediminis]|uniref:Uncharacterized protein n=1 Tax=Virgibacillus sediminis TaxID=202260 RepID=A0ABV7A9P6_9BACI